MVKQTIQIFARVKPTKAKTGLYEVDEDDSGSPRLSFVVPKDLASGLVNNKKEQYRFRFQRIFDQKTKQEEIFEHVAQPVIDNVLAGYNGTIFAYGQTGSGKTFTITGGAERYADRGIIPRMLSYIFKQYEKNPELEYTTHVSYLELYNESGYDLLDPKHEATKLEDLPKVSLMEDSDQNVHLKNLSTHQAGNEEEALNLLFLGDTNRMIAETPMNQASTRSHCIFTIHIMSREAGSATVKRSKLHLVDLAGSERVAKTGVNGLLLTEAKYINLSLHFLEQVIVALGEKSRSHIPYRNSMMTSVLRDSLGGNCMTTMIATCSVEKKNIDESISTCRFAQRVALIKNDALLNEELDPKLMITKLKGEVKQLKDELAMATGEQRTDELTEEELDRCQDAVKMYLDDTDFDATLNVGGDMRKIQQCYRIMKKMILERPSPTTSRQDDVAEEARPESPEQKVDSKHIKKLEDCIKQRDNEINILVNMLKKEKKRAADAIEQLNNAGNNFRSAPATPVANNELVNGSHGNHSTDRSSYHQSKSHDTGDAQPPRPRSGRPQSGRRRTELPKLDEKDEQRKAKILGEMSMGRQEAFEIFRRDYIHNQDIEDNKTTLKQRYAEAKSLGEKVNKARTVINKIKSQIEQHRMSRAMQGLVDPENPEPDDIEMNFRGAIEDEKSKYKMSFNRLKVLKTEIEHLQHLLEKSKVKLMKDFEIWWAEETARAEAMQQSVQQHHHHSNHHHGNHHHGKTKMAWKTPPLSPIRQSSDQSLQSQSSDPYNSSASFRPSNSGIGGATYIRSSNAADSTHDTDCAYTSSTRKARSDTNQASSSGVQLTGDAQTDADIMAFYKARQAMLKKAQQGYR